MASEFEKRNFCGNILFASLIPCTILMVLLSCEGSGKKEKIDSEALKEPLIQVNKTAAEIESGQIDGYVKRHNWEVNKTGTGLRYLVYEKGTGEQAKTGQVARVNFEISLLNGTVCYSTKESGPQEFLIGESAVESGLHEGITYLHVGDKAKLILPSHLAHGLVGDLNKIPPRSTVIYDIELVGLK